MVTAVLLVKEDFLNVEGLKALIGFGGCDMWKLGMANMEY